MTLKKEDFVGWMNGWMEKWMNGHILGNLAA